MNSSQEPHAGPDTGPPESGLPTAEWGAEQRQGDDTDAPEDGYFGASVAENYDDPSSDMFAPAAVEPAADLLAALAVGGPALEFGIGTGRIALPLARRGVPVHGIDLSRAMVEKLRAKPGGDAIGVTIGDFASTVVPGRGGFAVAYLVFNTIMNLTTQAEQVACFRNAAAHLAPGGTFVIEVGVPELRLLPPGQNAVPFQITANRWAFDHYDVATQAMSSNYVEVVDGRGSYRSIPFRYVWPAELDLMAQLAGMRLRDRWEGWGREPFTNESGRHVSVWEKAASADQPDGANPANRGDQLGA
ncbi:class I SAM-dependent DNA methyltransferase [Streptomyces candidus]|uniref:SAM-dependent methyltransferase n=1 Tax=Streptomyces candidus TaxID=67283 RepID=A0A7X0LSX5_9ACTN|nr:class I SAM-dependent methyltransferase [Streptomyces candidus]MBB6438914.1 SAM-dependent methyltransferase [Streptomyces candidus]GHH44232.1 methyltransferase [Streptomyces candidus]